MDRIQTYPVYASAYPRKHWAKGSKAECLTHAVEADEAGALVRVLCAKVKLDNICDNDLQQITDDEPTCKTCAAKLKKLRAPSG